ncbi:MAG: ADP-forming succinate--CoA ligase subunit beta [Planctomyces sp.]|nr:ADP-forming succinate--CoA ligase subunit beta [Planctomyces sp.]MBA4040118.1 ADP-forming succinate--CoA ligase subunit beta [Planctomyces sp.]MBA4119632.1 ADP-forming succinate--CoA ligase subunit beta [Isosphaera sp.]
MKIHEHQARDLLAQFGIPVPPGRVITDPAQAPDAFAAVSAGDGSALAVVKAQVHAGGRGKAGFVKLVRSAHEAADAARFMLTNRMVSPQTPPGGLAVSKLLVAAGAQIAERPRSAGGGREEFYLAITTDRASRRNVLIASRQGGVEIEQVAHDSPGAIIKSPLDPLLGLHPFQARRVAFALGFKGKQVGQAVSIMSALARLYVQTDCTLAEINPLVITPPTGEHPDGRVVAIDAKFNFDDNALFRHPELEKLHDASEENPAETKARALGLSYVALDGSIGCLVNGAGLAMATMDIIKLHGGEPANFLDVGGSASEEAVTEAFTIILSDARVRGVLVNIFGGIMRCDVIAQGIINAAKKLGFRVPLVVRLEGTNVEAGRRLLQSARADIPTMQAASDLADAAKKVCASVTA